MEIGIAFCEVSGDRLIRVESNDAEQAMGAGNTFFVFLRKGFPIHILSRIKEVPDVVTLFCATANSVQVIVAESEQERGVLGVIDGRGGRWVCNRQRGLSGVRDYCASLAMSDRVRMLQA